MSVNDVRAFTTEKLVKFPNCERVVQGNFATHLGNKDRSNSQFRREIAHVIFAWRDCAGNEQRLPIRSWQLAQPNNVFGRSSHIKARNHANNLHFMNARATCSD